MYYLIKDKLTHSSKKEVLEFKYPYIINIDSDKWEKEKNHYPISKEMEEEPELYLTKADVYYNHLSGSFSIPNHTNLDLNDYAFFFLLDEKGLIFVDDSGYVQEAINYILKTKKWHDPCLAKFIYDFLDYIVKDDLRIMEKYELELERMEDNGDKHSQEEITKLNQIRSEVRRFYIHYQELLDLVQELAENENGFFKPENLHFFNTLISRVERLLNTTSFLRDYTMQIDDMYREEIAIRQNNITTLLTVITTIFAPLTLITGWYGMNFKYMPELNQHYAYPSVIAVCILIAGLLLLYFKKKKWL